MSNLDHMARLRAFKEIATAPLQVPSVQTAYSRICSVFESYQTVGLVQNLVIVGDTGVGKSTLAKTVLRSHPIQHTRDRDIRPVAYASVPPAGTIGAIASAILEGLGDPTPYHGTTTKRAYRIKLLAHGCNVQMLLLDEDQHLYDRGKYQSRFLAGDWIKSLADELGVPVVLFGLPRLAELLSVNDQLRRRFTEVLHMGPPVDEGTESCETCLRLFMGFAEAADAGFDYAGGDWAEWAERLWYASLGRIGYLYELMLGVLILRTESGRLAITLDDLARAFRHRIWASAPIRLNPFSPDFEFRRLDRPGEPFGPEAGKVPMPMRRCA